MKFQCVTAIGIVSLLGACGGGSGVDHPELPLDEVPVPVIAASEAPSFASSDAATTEAGAALARAEPLDLTPLDEIPASGTAAYSGVLVLNDADGTAMADATVLGGVALAITFDGAGSVDATASNFRDLADTPVGGALVLSDGQLSVGSDSGSLAGSFTGRLTDVGPPGVDADYDYSLSALGIYSGDDIAVVQLLTNGDALEVGGATLHGVEGAATLEKD